MWLGRVPHTEERDEVRGRQGRDVIRPGSTTCHSSGAVWMGCGGGRNTSERRTQPGESLVAWTRRGVRSVLSKATGQRDSIRVKSEERSRSRAEHGAIATIEAGEERGSAKENVGWPGRRRMDQCGVWEGVSEKREPAAGGTRKSRMQTRHRPSNMDVTGDPNNRFSRLVGRKGPQLDWRRFKAEWEERPCRLGGETTLAGLLHKGKKKSEAAVAGRGTGVLRGVLFTCFSFKMSNSSWMADSDGEKTEG